MTRVYSALGVVALLVLGGYGLYSHGVKVGADRVTIAFAQANAAAAKKEQAQATEVIKWRTKKEVIYREKIRTIKVAADPTGCLDADLTDVGLGGLLRADSN